jgi:cytochrome c-type biogenesis protein CcmH/NrfF
MIRRLPLLFALGAALAVAPPVLAADCGAVRAQLEGEIICPTCHTPLDQSNAPIARRMKRFISERCAAGDTKGEIKAQLVADFGPAVLASPPKRGFHLLAWLLPLAGAVLGAGALGVAAWRWSRARDDEPALGEAEPSPNGRVALDPALERRLDEELARFDG